MSNPPSDPSFHSNTDISRTFFSIFIRLIYPYGSVAFGSHFNC